MKSKLHKATRALNKSIPKAKSDPQRPLYHFASPANWMNDPNGTIYHNKEYHLFYQFNPAKPKWGNLHWGHAKSKDLIHWEHLPIALAPDGVPKEMHCWSGCCVIADDGTPTIFYTSMNLPSLLRRARRFSQQWMAVGSPDLITWEKYSDNPILSEVIHGDQPPQQWRDPYVWKEGDDWYMILAGEDPGEKLGRVFLYRSQNLTDWEYLGILSQDSNNRGRGWECPNYFRLGEKYVLVISPYGPVIYSVGEFDGRQHHTDAWFTLDHGKDFYATNTYVDDQGRTILVGWIKAKGVGWAGCLSLPREVSLVNCALIIKPLAELQKLRKSHQHLEHKMESVVEIAEPASFYGGQLEIKACFELEKAEAFGFKLIDDKAEQLISFDFPIRELQVFDEFAQLQFVGEVDPLDVHIFIDHSVVEIFINEREVFSTVFQPQLADIHSLKVTPFIAQGKGKFSLDVWHLNDAPVAGKVSEI